MSNRQVQAGDGNVGVLWSENGIPGNSLAVQWLELSTFTAEDPGSIPGRGTEIPQDKWCGQKKKVKNGISHVLG